MFLVVMVVVMASVPATGEKWKTKWKNKVGKWTNQCKNQANIFAQEQAVHANWSDFGQDVLNYVSRETHAPGFNLKVSSVGGSELQCKCSVPLEYAVTSTVCMSSDKFSKWKVLLWKMQYGQHVDCWNMKTLVTHTHVHIIHITHIHTHARTHILMSMYIHT